MPAKVIYMYACFRCTEWNLSNRKSNSSDTQEHLEIDPHKYMYPFHQQSNIIYELMKYTLTPVPHKLDGFIQKAGQTMLHETIWCSKAVRVHLWSQSMDIGEGILLHIDRACISVIFQMRLSTNPSIKFIAILPTELWILLHAHSIILIKSLRHPYTSLNLPPTKKDQYVF